MTLLLPRGAEVAVVDHVTAMGTAGAGVETGGFMLGRDRCATVLAIAGETDVRRARDLFVVGGRACAHLFEHADAHGLTLLCQWHSHRGRAAMSRSDVKHGFNMPGLHSMIVPHYTRPPHEARAWGCWRFAGAHWARTAVPEVTPGDCSVVVFDGGGVRAA